MVSYCDHTVCCHQQILYIKSPKSQGIHWCMFARTSSYEFHPISCYHGNKYENLENSSNAWLEIFGV